MTAELMYRVSIVMADVAGVIIAYNLFSGFFEERKNVKAYKNYILAGIIVVLSIVNVWIVPSDYFIVLSLVTYIMMAVLMFRASFLSKVLVGLFYILFGLVAEIIVGYIAAMVLKVPIAELGQKEGVFIIGTMTSKLVLFMIVKILLRITSKERYHITLTNWLMLLTIPTISVVMSLFVIGIQYDVQSLVQGNIVLASGLLYLNLIAFGLFDSIGTANRLAKIAEKKNEQLLLQQERYQERLDSYKALRRIKHDLHNHLIVLDKMVENRSYKEAKHYLQEMEGVVERATEASVTGNIVIDAIVQSKILYAKEKGIQTFMNIQVPNQMAIDMVDLSIVLGNALDNAIEACQYEGDGVKDQPLSPSIDVMIKLKSGNLLIKVVNTIYEKPYKVGEERLFRSGKGKGHGFGLENVETVINRYKGNLVVEVIGNYFNFSALIPEVVSR